MLGNCPWSELTWWLLRNYPDMYQPVCRCHQKLYCRLASEPPANPNEPFSPSELQNCRIATSEESLIRQHSRVPPCLCCFYYLSRQVKRVRQVRGIYPVLLLSNRYVVPISKILQSRVLNYSRTTFQRPTVAMAKVLEYPGSSERLFSLGDARYMVRCSTKVRRVTSSFNITTN